MINYAEKGIGLHDAIVAAGHSLALVDDVWVSDDDAAVQAIIDAYPVSAFIAERQLQSILMAKALRNQVVSAYSHGETASWPIKAAEAQAFAANPVDASAPLLAAEASARGMPLATLVGVVAANARTFSMLEATIAGVDGRHRDALAALTTFADVQAYDLTVGWPPVPAAVTQT